MVEVRPVGNQVDDLLEEIRKVTAREERVLVTVLTKKLAEQLTSYYQELGIKAEYLHSEIDTLERVELLKDLRRGTFDVLIGINLLREGLDLPEVSLVAILDADKEGYLRSARSLIQTIGRAARNVNGRALLYADNMTGSMTQAIGETERRRAKQVAYNKVHGITPETIRKNIDDVLGEALAREFVPVPKDKAADEPILYLDDVGFERELAKFDKQMRDHASRMEFESAAALRDRILKLRRERLINVTVQTGIL
jgi:excinuclease ABC subunit B